MLRVVVIGPSQPIYREGTALEVITPGHIVASPSQGNVRKNTVAGQANAANNAQILVAVENDIFGKGIDDAYAVGDVVIYQHLLPGCSFMGLVPAGAAAIAYDDYITTDGAGGVIKGDASNAIGRARVALNNSGSASAARIRVHVG